MLPLALVFDFDRIDAVGAATVFLGVATLGLAIAAFLQLRAGRQEREIAQKALAVAQKQAEVAQRTLEAQIRPVLVEVPVNLGKEDYVQYPDDAEKVSNVEGGILVHAGEDRVRCSVPFRNVGKGVAQIETAYIEAGGGHSAYRAADLTRPNVAVGELTRANFVLRTGDRGFDGVSEQIREQNDLLVACRYADIAGGQVTTTWLWVRRDPGAHTGWNVAYVEVGEPDAGEAPPPGATGPPPV